MEKNCSTMTAPPNDKNWGKWTEKKKSEFAENTAKKAHTYVKQTFGLQYKQKIKCEGAPSHEKSPQT